MAKRKKPKDESILVCAPEAWPAVHGSTLEPCSNCQQGIWVSPSTRNLEEIYVFKKICVPCSLILVTPDVAFAPLTPGQRAEIDAHLTRRN